MVATCQVGLARAALDANPTAPDHGADQMDAKAHPARPVHHRDAEEMFCPVRRHHRQEAAVASVDQVADLVAAVRHNFRESFPVRDPDYRLSASEDVEAYSIALQDHPKLPLAVDQSAAREPGVRIVQIAKVVGRPSLRESRVPRVAAHLKKAQIAAAMAHRVEVPADAEPQALACLRPRMESESLAQPELLPEQEPQASPQQAQE
jgi:hypothetical protein